MTYVAVLYDCPFCDKEHVIEIRIHSSIMLINNEPVEYIGTFYYCPLQNEEFTPARVNDENISAAMEQYRNMKK
jgi:hypothetical protein